MRFKKDPDSKMIQVFGETCEIAYAKLGVSGLEATIEFPSDWHEDQRAWVRLGLGFGKICFSFPWYKVVPDEYQCSGPTYGFQFHSDILWIKYGKSKGTRDDPVITVDMPWGWKHQGHEVLSDEETHDYTYVLKSGEVQKRKATIKAEKRTWTRVWIPSKLVVQSIEIEFNNEVGERTGSWKGGCTGCGYEMLDGESPLQTLRRMEKERKF